MSVDPKTKRVVLAIEFAMLFIVIPAMLLWIGTRMGIYLAVWGGGLYAFAMLRRAPDFSWRKLWHGEGWTETARRQALLRFLVLAVLLAGLTLILLPERFLRFPLERFPLWLAVMALYPLLSIVPQELLFRSFYFMRYRDILTEKSFRIVLNGIVFGFGHIVLNNWIAPSCCVLAGIILAQSYQQHRSLKWAVIEHTLYGNWVFTVGIGWYFFTGNLRS